MGKRLVTVKGIEQMEVDAVNCINAVVGVQKGFSGIIEEACVEVVIEVRVELTGCDGIEVVGVLFNDVGSVVHGVVSLS